MDLDVFGLSDSHDEKLDVNLVDEFVMEMLDDSRQGLKAVQLKVFGLLNRVPWLGLDYFSIVKLDKVNQYFKVRGRLNKLQKWSLTLFLNKKRNTLNHDPFTLKILFMQREELLVVIRVPIEDLMGLILNRKNQKDFTQGLPGYVSIFKTLVFPNIIVQIANVLTVEVKYEFLVQKVSNQD